MLVAFIAIDGTAPSTSKHWLDHTPQCEHFALKHQLVAGTTIAESKQRSLCKVTTVLCFGIAVVERIPDQCQDSSHSASSAKASRFICSDFTSTLHSRTPDPPKKEKCICTCMFLLLALNHSTYSLEVSLISSSNNHQTRV